MTLICAAAVAVSYADRSVAAVAAPALAKELGLGYAETGEVLGAFFLGYGATQIAAGSVADRNGGREVLAVGVLAWGLATLATPSAARLGAAPLLLVRAALGAAEGLCFPACHSLISVSVPPRQQSAAVGVATAASYLGVAAAFKVVPFLVDSEELGWPYAFYLFGALALLWLPLATFLPARGARAAGRTDEYSSMATPSTAQASVTGRKRDSLATKLDSMLGSVNWPLMRTPQAVAIMAAQYFNSCGMYGLVSWLPTWLEEQGGRQTAEALGTAAAAPYLLQAAVGVFAGLAADAAIGRGSERRAIRVAAQSVGMLAPALCLMLAVRPGTEPDTAVALVIAGSAANALTLAGVSANALDVAPAGAGQLFAAGNTAATMAGLVVVPLTGAVLGAADGTSEGLSTAFTLCAAHYVVGLAAFATLAGGQRLKEDVEYAATE